MNKTKRHDLAAASAWLSQHPWPVAMIAVIALGVAAAFHFNWLDGAPTRADHQVRRDAGQWVMGLIGAALLVRAALGFRGRAPLRDPR